MSSLRQLAEKLDLSHATVSAALNGKPGVKAATRARVLAAAAALGYRNNPLASALMGELRRSRGAVFRGVVGLLAPPLKVAPGDRPGPTSQPACAEAALERGVRARAAQLGFQVDLLRLDPADPEPARLGGILEARGIRGVVVLPGASPRALRTLDWSVLAGVSAGDDAGDAFGLHTVAPDPLRAMERAFHELRRLGYRRPGLVLCAGLEAGARLRWAAAYHACRLETAESPVACPPFAAPSDQPDPEAFRHWLSATRPDVVLAHDPAVLDWMRAAGAIVPETHGFCALDLDPARPGPLAGLSPRTEEIGAHALDLLAGRLLRHETGRPALPLATLLPPDWLPGDTLREQPGPARACDTPRASRPRAERLSLETAIGRRSIARAV